MFFNRGILQIYSSAAVLLVNWTFIFYILDFFYSFNDFSSSSLYILDIYTPIYIYVGVHHRETW